MKFLPSDQNIVREVVEPNVTVEGFASAHGLVFIPVRAIIGSGKRYA